MLKLQKELRERTFSHKTTLGFASPKWGCKGRKKMTKSLTHDREARKESPRMILEEACRTNSSD